jgi:hypothetical protein
VQPDAREFEEFQQFQAQLQQFEAYQQQTESQQQQQQQQPSQAPTSVPASHATSIVAAPPVQEMPMHVGSLRMPPPPQQRQIPALEESVVSAINASSINASVVDTTLAAIGIGGMSSSLMISPMLPPPRARVAPVAAPAPVEAPAPAMPAPVSSFAAERATTSAMAMSTAQAVPAVAAQQVPEPAATRMATPEPEPAAMMDSNNNNDNDDYGMDFMGGDDMDGFDDHHMGDEAAVTAGTESTVVLRSRGERIARTPPRTVTKSASAVNANTGVASQYAELFVPPSEVEARCAARLAGMTGGVE